MIRKGLLALAFAVLAMSTVAAQSRGSIEVEDAWVPPTPGGAKTAAVYLTIRNTGSAPDRLVGATTPAAEHAGLHATMHDGDMMSMHHMDAVEVPAGGTALFAPNGSHVMLMGLKAPLKLGDKVPLTLKFQGAGDVSVVATVRR